MLETNAISQKHNSQPDQYGEDIEFQLGSTGHLGDETAAQIRAQLEAKEQQAYTNSIKEFQRKVGAGEDFSVFPPAITAIKEQFISEITTGGEKTQEFIDNWFERCGAMVTASRELARSLHDIISDKLFNSLSSDLQTKLVKYYDRLYSVDSFRYLTQQEYYQKVKEQLQYSYDDAAARERQVVESRGFTCFPEGLGFNFIARLNGRANDISDLLLDGNAKQLLSLETRRELGRLVLLLREKNKKLNDGASISLEKLDEDISALTTEYESFMNAGDKETPNQKLQTCEALLQRMKFFYENVSPFGGVVGKRVSQELFSKLEDLQKLKDASLDTKYHFGKSDIQGIERTARPFGCPIREMIYLIDGKRTWGPVQGKPKEGTGYHIVETSLPLEDPLVKQLRFLNGADFGFSDDVFNSKNPENPEKYRAVLCRPMLDREGQLCKVVSQKYLPMTGNVIQFDAAERLTPATLQVIFPPDDGVSGFQRARSMVLEGPPPAFHSFDKPEIIEQEMMTREFPLHAEEQPSNDEVADFLKDSSSLQEVLSHINQVLTGGQVVIRQDERSKLIVSSILVLLPQQLRQMISYGEGYITKRNAKDIKIIVTSVSEELNDADKDEREGSSQSFCAYVRVLRTLCTRYGAKSALQYVSTLPALFNQSDQLELYKILHANSKPSAGISGSMSRWVSKLLDS